MKSRELGILFKPDMHLAIREDRKTQTRRIVKPQGPVMFPMVINGQPTGDWFIADHPHEKRTGSSGYFPRYRVGDLLYVKEAYASPSKHIVAYKLGAECGAWMDDGNGGRFFHHHGLIIESPDYSSACRERKFVDTYGLAKYGGVPRGEFPYRYGWKSPLHMPKWAARTWLEVTSVRAERLQDISEADAIAEGFSGQLPQPTSTARDHFAYRFDAINGPGSWESNPWVWVYEFRRIER